MLDKRLFATVIVVYILVACGADLLNPALPDLQRHFALSVRETSWVLNTNFAGFCVATIVAGMLGDRIDKRTLIVGGLVLFVVGSLLALSAPSFGMLLLGRFMQGVGAAFPAVLGFVLLVESSPSSMHTELSGVLASTVSVAACLAPVGGSLIAGAWGWRANFGALLGVAACAICLASLFLPTSPGNVPRTESSSSYRPIVTSGQWWFLTTIVSLLRGNYLAFASFSSILFIGELGADVRAFGFYQGALAVTFALSSAGCGRIVGALGARRAVTISLAAMPVASGLMLLYVVATAVPRAIVVTLFMVAVSAFAVFPLNVLNTMSLSVVPEARSRASAASNVVKFCVTGVLVWCFALPTGQKATCIAALLFASYLICLCMFLAAPRGVFVLPDNAAESQDTKSSNMSQAAG